MKRRFTLPVAHVSYDVELVRKHPRVEGRPVQGYCDFVRRKIVVHIVPNVELLRQTIRHEYFHALFHELGHPQMANDEALVEGCALAEMRVRLEVPWL